MKKSRREILDIFHQAGLSLGRHVLSRHSYEQLHPGSRLIQNACVFTRDGKIWGGDLDLASCNVGELQTASRRLRRKLFVLREQPDPERLSRDRVILLAEATVWRDRVKFFNPAGAALKRLHARGIKVR